MSRVPTEKLHTMYHGGFGVNYIIWEFVENLSSSKPHFIEENMRIQHNILLSSEILKNKSFV